MLNVGESRKDLDIYFLPMSDENDSDQDGLKAALDKMWGEGEDIIDPQYSDLQTAYEYKWKYYVGRKRIDVFIMRG